MTQLNPSARRLSEALAHEAASVRLRAAMDAGTHPDPAFVEVLIGRCGVEPDFFVRDMLTWALLFHDQPQVVDALMGQLASELPQARSQALHSLSKIGDARAWPAITVEHLTDADETVARTAWRAASGLVPQGQEGALAEILATQFGRGDRMLRRSLSRSLARLGPAALPAIERAKGDADPEVRAHALATERLMVDPEADFDALASEAQRMVTIATAPLAP